MNISVEKILIHQDYYQALIGNLIVNDIALLKLSVDLNFTRAVKPISLPRRNYTSDDLQQSKTTRLIVAGWGEAIDNITEQANLSGVFPYFFN